eukprot:gene23380-30300_t
MLSTSANTFPVGWVLNDTAPACMICGVNFTIFNNRHHCRSCGDVVCGPCSKARHEIAELDLIGPLRVCKNCTTDSTEDEYRKSRLLGQWGTLLWQSPQSMLATPSFTLSSVTTTQTQSSLKTTEVESDIINGRVTTALRGGDGGTAKLCDFGLAWKVAGVAGGAAPTMKKSVQMIVKGMCLFVRITELKELEQQPTITDPPLINMKKTFSVNVGVFNSLCFWVTNRYYGEDERADARPQDYIISLKKVDINAANNDGFTAIIAAAKRGHLLCLEYLIGQGAVVDAANKNGMTAIMCAAKAGDLPCLQYLIEQKPDAKNARSVGGFTAIMYAAHKGDLRCLKYLVEQGADTSLSDDKEEPIFSSVEEELETYRRMKAWLNVLCYRGGLAA